MVVECQSAQYTRFRRSHDRVAMHRLTALPSFAGVGSTFFFDRMSANDSIVHAKSGSINKCFDVQVGDVLVCQDTGTAGSRGEGGDGEHGIELEALIEAKNGPDASVRLSWRVEGGAVLRYGRNVSLREVDRVGWDGGLGGGGGG